MTETEVPQARSERTYRRLHAALSAASGLTLGVLIAFGYPLVGVSGFALLFAIAGYLQVTYPATLFDERDRRVHERASGWTLALFGWACALFFPTMTVLVALGYTTWPDWLVPIALLVPVVYGVYGLLMLVARRGP
jgi:uncharacterized membrane protein